MAKRIPDIRSTRVEVKLDGKSYAGTYSVTGGLISVSLPGARSKSAQVGDAAPADLAAKLLEQIVSERHKRPAAKG